MTPPWVLALVLATQLTINYVGSGSNPSCTLNVQRPHHSTYLVEHKNADAIKVNVKSKCTVPQISTTISAEIYELRGNQSIKVFSVKNQTAFADKRDPTESIFQNFSFVCQTGRTGLYLGSASGSVLLTNGKTIQVSGNSGNYHPEICENTAK